MAKLTTKELKVKIVDWFFNDNPQFVALIQYTFRHAIPPHRMCDDIRHDRMNRIRKFKQNGQVVREFWLYQFGNVPQVYVYVYSDTADEKVDKIELRFRVNENDPTLDKILENC